jgi:glucose/arabinose dehydrogenase
MHRWLCLLLLGCGNATTSAPAQDFSVSSDDLTTAGVDLAGSCGTLKLTPLVTGLAQPTFAAAEDAHRLFIAQRGGKVRLAVDGTLQATPFLDLTAQVASAGDDDGLLGLVLHPQFTANGRFFVQYSDKSSNVVIAEYARSAGDPNAATPTATQTLLTQAVPSGIRYGGMLAFGPDGFLYSGVGDGDSEGDPLKNAQNLSSPLGKILRFDANNPGTPPAGNLMGNVWDYGFREPWRFSFDRQNGDLYIADVGHPSDQEVNVEPAGQGGKNYGWPTAAGSHCFKPGCRLTGLVPPTVEYPKTSGCAIIGGYVYRGAALSCLDGWYVYSDWCKPKLHVWKGGTSMDLPVSIGSVSSFAESADGELLIVDYDGNISRLDPG